MLAGRQRPSQVVPPRVSGRLETRPWLTPGAQVDDRRFLARCRFRRPRGIACRDFLGIPAIVCIAGSNAARLNVLMPRLRSGLGAGFGVGVEFGNVRSMCRTKLAQPLLCGPITPPPLAGTPPPLTGTLPP